MTPRPPGPTTTAMRARLDRWITRLRRFLYGDERRGQFVAEFHMAVLPRDRRLVVPIIHVRRST